MNKVHSLITAKRLGPEETYLGLLPGFEGNESTKRRRLMCRRCEKGNEAEQKVGQRIAACRKKRPCGSGACDVCLKRARERIIPQAAYLLHKELKKAERRWKKHGRKLGHHRPKLWSVTVVDDELATPRGQLDPGRVKRRAEALRKAIKRSSLSGARIFGGVDVSLNIPVEGGPGVWMPHFYILVVGTYEDVDAVFRPMFPAKLPDVPRPVQINDACCIPSSVSYAIKSQFSRRTKYVASSGGYSTNTKGLKSEEKRELAVFLDGLGVGARLILCGLKIIKGRLIRV